MKSAHEVLEEYDREKIRDRLEKHGYPVELTDVEGVGQKRADELHEYGVRDMIDLVAATHEIGEHSPNKVAKTIWGFPNSIARRIQAHAKGGWGDVFAPMAPEDSTSEGSSEETTEIPDDAVEVISSNRPLPRSARRAITDEHTVYDSEVLREPGRQEMLFLDEEPREDLISDYELVVNPPGMEVWKAGSNETIRITTDGVEINGQETTMDPEEAAARCRDEDHFTPVEIPDESPFAE